MTHVLVGILEAVIVGIGVIGVVVLIGALRLWWHRRRHSLRNKVEVTSFGDMQQMSDDVRASRARLFAQRRPR
jgi:hypothetical protein